MTKHIKALDGVRGIAILMVLVFHFGAFHPNGFLQRALSGGIKFGWCGVDLFFCLSGFLITGILLRTVADAGYFRLFYARRVLRIFPAYYVYVALTVMLVIAGHRFGYFNQMTTHSQIWAWLYLSNWRDPGLPYTAHLWSLSIEEQFYLAWPLLIFTFRRRALPFCLWLGRRNDSQDDAISAGWSCPRGRCGLHCCQPRAPFEIKRAHSLVLSHISGNCGRACRPIWLGCRHKPDEHHRVSCTSNLVFSACSALCDDAKRNHESISTPTS